MVPHVAGYGIHVLRGKILRDIASRGCRRLIVLIRLMAHSAPRGAALSAGVTDDHANSQYEAREIAPIAHEGQTLRGLAVRVREGVHSHNHEQLLYFGQNGLPRRDDCDVSRRECLSLAAARCPCRYGQAKHMM